MDVIRNNNFCRLCLCRDSVLHHVFESKEIGGRTAAHVIIELLGIQVSPNDIYPKCVCIECIEKLLDFKLFKQKCESNKEFLDRAYAGNEGCEPNNESLSNHVGDESELYFKKEDVEIPMENDNVDSNERLVSIKTEIDDSYEESNVISCDEAIESEDQVSISVKNEYEDPSSTAETDHVSTPDNSSAEAAGSNEGMAEMNVTCAVSYADKNIKEETVDIPAETETQKSFDEGIPLVSGDGLMTCTVNNYFDIPPIEGRHPHSNIANVYDSHYSGIPSYEESPEELQAMKKRVTFPTYVEPPTKVPLSSAEELDVALTAGNNNAIMAQKAKATARKVINRRSQQVAFEKFSEVYMTEADPLNASNRDDVAILRKRVKELEKEVEDAHLVNVEKIQSNLIEKMTEKMDALKYSLESQIKIGFQSLRQEANTLYETMKTNGNNMSTTSTSSDTVTVNSGDFVILSEKWGIRCSKICCEQMSQATKDADWANALLRGVFGSEASRYRVYPRNEANKKFPKEFLDTAKGCSGVEGTYESSTPNQPRERSFKCTRCGKEFVKKGHLDRHLLIHSGERPHRCPQCGKTFSVKAYLKTHMMTHSGQRPFKCDQCCSAFYLKSDLNRHKTIHSGDRPYKCDHCGKSFMRKNQLEVHAMVHSEERQRLAFDERNETFDYNLNPETDAMRREMVPFNGNTETFTYNLNPEAHMSTVSDETALRCEQCNKTFSAKGALRRHEVIHSGMRPFECTECGKTFSIKSYLKSHMMTHSGEKPYKCDQCCSAFSLKSDLNRHKMTHSGDRPFKCQRCSKNFLRRKQLEIHMTTHSSD